MGFVSLLKAVGQVLAKGLNIALELDPEVKAVVDALLPKAKATLIETEYDSLLNIGKQVLTTEIQFTAAYGAAKTGAAKMTAVTTTAIPIVEDILTKLGAKNIDATVLASAAGQIVQGIVTGLNGANAAP